MKVHECQVWGDLSSDRASEQYPIVDVCEICYNKMKSVEEAIITEERVYSSNDFDCYYCGRDWED